MSWLGFRLTAARAGAMSDKEWAPAKLSVVIPCLNCSGTIRRLVQGLLDQYLPEGVALDIVLADNGSTDESLSCVRDLPVRIVTARRKGPAAARNAGLGAADGDIVCFLDADTRPVNRFLLSEHMETLKRDKGIWISGGSISPDPEQRSPVALAENMTGLFNWHDGLPARYLTFQPMGNLAFRRELVKRIGMLNEDLLWLEDFDWSARVLQARGKIYFNPLAGVYIRGRESFGAAVKKFFRWGINVKSVYVPGRREQLWVCKSHPILFNLNALFRFVNESYVTLKRWFPRKPLKAIILLPLILCFRAAWAAGIVAGSGKIEPMECRPPGESGDA